MSISPHALRQALDRFFAAQTGPREQLAAPFAATQLFGYTRSEALGRHAVGLLVPEEARESVDRIWQGLLARTGGTRSTNQNLTKSGRRIVCDIAPLVATGDPS